jgi:hypothetical protein
LQGLEQPEWSHLSHAAAEQYSASLYRIIERDFWGPAALATRGTAQSAR